MSAKKVKAREEMTITSSSSKIAHWVMLNGSGMHRVAESMARAEAMSGLNSWLVDCTDLNGFDEVLDADIHVIHTHLPDAARPRLKKQMKLVWIAHGTPEYVFRRSVEAGINKGYGAEDSWQLCQYWMQSADALVTFWPRHQAIWQSLCDKRTVVDCIPMGIETDFWHPVESQGRYLGSPSLFTAENCDQSKWPLDLFIAWPWVWPEVPEAFLHSVYLPTDQHRWFYPLINRNGCAFKTISAGMVFNQFALRNAFCSVDYFIGLVRYGDANRLCREANASGARTITYAGNEYSDFWVTEGDQRIIARELIAILKGDVEPRKKKPIPDVKDMCREMIKIYERIL